MPYLDQQGREYTYGEFFPVELSPWMYNETHGIEFFPKTKEEALAEGFRWRDPDKREYRPGSITPPDDIYNTDESILKEILACESCAKNYQIIPMELAFYRKMGIPVPTHCPLCRDRARIRRMNPIALNESRCAKCEKAIKTTYRPESGTIVYCESCYSQEIV